MPSSLQNFRVGWSSTPTVTSPAAAPTGTCTSHPAGHNRTVAVADDDRPKAGGEVHLPAVLLKTGDSCIVVASKGGALQHPDWYRNLVANPEVEVQVGTQKMKAGARTATGEERTRLWQEALKFWPPYAEYSARPSARSRWWCWILCAPAEPCGKMLPR